MKPDIYEMEKRIGNIEATFVPVFVLIGFALFLHSCPEAPETEVTTVDVCDTP